MTTSPELIPHLFRTESRRLISLLCRSFGLSNIQVAEDIVSETFMLAAETWGLKGTPKNPSAWLYTVAKNKVRDHLRRNSIFRESISPELKIEQQHADVVQLDFSETSLKDSQLQMMFALCHPLIPKEAQIGLALRILCGFGIVEIADALLSNKETINKRLFRAKQALREANVEMEIPEESAIPERLNTVLKMIYLLFNEGYYSRSQNETLRKDLCLEALRLGLQLLENPLTKKPQTYALMALMCFHVSRFEARLQYGEAVVLYDEQDRSLWDKSLVLRGEQFLSLAAIGKYPSTYHLQAAIAYWHTQEDDAIEKWEKILSYYNLLLQIEYSPVAALNRTYALSRVRGKSVALIEAKKLNLDGNHLYHALLAELNRGIDKAMVRKELELAISYARTSKEKELLKARLDAFYSR